MNTNNTIFSITQITNQVKYSLEKNYNNIWIKGEIVTCNPYPSGHIYMTLKDENSELSAVIFSKYLNNISFVPQIGTNVVANGDLTIYTFKGKFQLQIKNIYPSGDGKLWISYDILKNRLEKEGLFSLDKKKNIPRFPKKVGIITSTEGAVLKDVLKILSRRSPHVECFIIPVPVQGKSAAIKISKAISKMNNYNIDTLILCRGGGSIEDLWTFNEEEVVRSIFASKIPIITGIGHETDTTLSDYVADLRASTPSSAAELISQDRSDIIQMLDNYNEKLNFVMLQKISNCKNYLQSYHNRHGLYMPYLIVSKMKDNYNNLIIRFNKAVSLHLKQKNIHLDISAKRLKLLNPNFHLKRGFSIITDEKNNIIISPHNLKINSIVTIKMYGGTVSARLIKKGDSNE